MASVHPVTVTRNPTVKVQRSRLTLDDYLVIMEQAITLDTWVPNALRVALITGQRLEDVSAMRFTDVKEGWLHIKQRKTGTMLRLSLDVRLDAIGMSIGDVLSYCRDSAVRS